MSFEQKPFLILFAVVFAWWWVVRRREHSAVALLLAASLLFYAYNHWFLLPILLAYCVVNWFVARRVETSPRPKPWLWGRGRLQPARPRLLQVHPAPGADARRSRARLPDRAGRCVREVEHPYGISFYAFTGIAYMVDVYRKTTPAEPSLRRYALSACFFPHLVAGPILRPHEFLDKVRPGRLPTEPDGARRGVLADRPRVLQEAGHRGPHRR